MRTLLRLITGYLVAVLAAMGGFLLVDTIVMAERGRTMEALRDLSSAAIIYAPYALGFTLALGLVGLALLRLVKASSWWAYAAVGALLGFFTAGLEDGFNRHNRFAVPFAVAGFVAALAFHLVYRREPRARPSGFRHGGAT